MRQYSLAMYCDHAERLFELGTAAKLARVSEDYRYDREGLLKADVMLHGKKGLCFPDVCKLKPVRLGSPLL